LTKIQRKKEEQNEMKLRPLHDRVLVELANAETKTAGGILIPDSATEKPVRGKILATGKGKILESGDIRPLQVKVGDEVMFNKYSGTEVKIDGKTCLMMREEDILGVVE
jgi:chaperonin GroES